MMRGFSLIEIMLVIAAWMIILTLVGVNTSFMNKCIARSEIDLLQATCIHLQHTALSSGKPQQLLLDEQANSYSYNGHTHTFPASVKFGVLPHVQGPPSSPTHALSSAITFTGKSITFHPDGIIQSGVVYVVDTSSKSLYALSSPIAQVSFLRKYRYDGKWHVMNEHFL